MEISALNSAHYTPAAVESRNVRVVRDKVAQEAAVSMPASGNSAGPYLSPRTQELEAWRSAREIQREREAQTRHADFFRFEDEGGTRVVKALSLREVLIYQMPTRGQLALISAEQAATGRTLAQA